MMCESAQHDTFAHVADAEHQLYHVSAREA